MIRGYAMPLPLVFLFAALLYLNGCAAEVVRYSTELVDEKPLQSKLYITSQPALITLDSSYQRTINTGTEFVEFGTIKQGKVLKPRNAVFTIEGAHIHEAYPVVESSRIVGFYLPVEKAFSPLSQSSALHLQEKDSGK
jgi:hypothetical protein